MGLITIESPKRIMACESPIGGMCCHSFTYGSCANISMKEQGLNRQKPNI